ncbi:MAG TPA: Fe-Mn family superoxide dismutase [Chloroflexota bacterium]|nr:Fe-Mn family superoxide dismutase [Chloroflexota bacterium]
MAVSQQANAGTGAALPKGPYKVHDFSNLKGLTGISDTQIEVHLKLYEGYVNNTNLLTEHLWHMINNGQQGTPEYAELTRRLGFEYDGMIFHEYYFGNLVSGAKQLDPNSAFGKAAAGSFGSVDTWMKDFRALGSMRGIGWVITFQDPVTGWLSNFWVAEHQNGVPGGFKPILVMDVWEHAFMIDYRPAEKGKYIDAFFQNVDWAAIEKRLQSPSATRPIG